METLNHLEPLTASIIDALPEAVLLYIPICAPTAPSVPVDFQLRYCNQEVTRVLGIPRDMLIGQTVQTTAMFDAEGRENTFRKLFEVWTNDIRQTESVFHPKLGLHLEAIRKKAMGGVIVITRDRTPEVQAEAALLEQERMFRSIIDTAQDGVMVLEPLLVGETITDFRVSFCNDYAHRVGRIPANALNRTLLELFPKLQGTAHFGYHAAVVHSGEPVRFETAFYDTDGSQFGWFIVSLTWVNRTLISRFTDISEQKEYERGVEAQRDLLRSIQDASQNALFACELVRDPQGVPVDLRVIKVNDSFTRINGVRPEQIEGKLFLAFFPMTKTSGVFDRYCQVAIDKIPYQDEVHYSGEGMEGWYGINAVPWGAEGLVVSFADISEQKRSRVQLEGAARYLQQVIDVAPTGIFSLAPVHNESGQITNFRFRSVNRTLAAYVHQQPEALIGGLHDDWFPAYRSNGTFEIYERISRQGGEERFERHYQDERVEVWMDVTVKGVDGDVLVSFHDFTAIKQLQLQLESTVEQLRRSNESLEEFAYAASHDLQEPLRKINVFASNLQDTLSGGLNEQQVRSFTRMKDAVQRMRSLIDDLLTFAQFGRAKADFSTVNLNQVLQVVLQDLEASIQETGARIGAGAMPTISGDERQLRQLLQNLLGNAIKYRKPGVVPEVRIESRTVRSGDAVFRHFPTVAPAAYQLISVTDNGIGFEQQYAERIFQVFQRLHGNAEYKGTGVGLAIVKKVVENHKGFIAAVGEPGNGATFLMLLPGM